MEEVRKEETGNQLKRIPIKIQTVQEAHLKINGK